MSTDFTIDEILEGLKTFPTSYPHDLIAAAVERKEEITPRLIQILKDVLADPEAVAGDENYAGHMFAVYLLGHFRETAAHEFLAKLLVMPDDLGERLFGDVITENFPWILVRTSGGSLDLIKSMVLNRNLDDYHRGAAVAALPIAVVEGLATREEVLSFFSGLFTGDEADEESDFWTFVADGMCDLRPEEYMDVILTAYDDDLIDPGYIDLDSFALELNLGKEAWWEKFERVARYKDLDDLYSCMSWWTEPLEKLWPEREPLPEIAPPSPNTIKAKKKKRKAAKASKKKNRRK